MKAPRRAAAVSLLIPTRDAGPQFEALLDAALYQSYAPHELRVVDSGSRDGTADLARRHGAQVTIIDPLDFDHGLTRNALAREATGDVLVFLTQDAVPADDRWLEHLIAPLLNEEADAAFSRQLPRPGASPLEAFARRHGYPPEPRSVTRLDVPRLGIWAYQFSNTASAVRRDVHRRLGGFPAGYVMSEDLLFAVRLLEAGGTIAYAAESRVVHSHAYGLGDTFRRYFDIGTVMSSASGDLVEAGRLPAGSAYVQALLRHLVREREFGWLPPALAESAAKATGYALGRNATLLPVALRRRMSLHPDYWTTSRNA